MLRTFAATCALLTSCTISTAQLAPSGPAAAPRPAPATAAPAAPVPAPTTAPAAPLPPTLGQRVTGMYDVSFQPFLGAKKVDRLMPTELLRFTRDDKKWTLIFDRAELPQPIPLRDTRDANGIDQPGYLTAASNLIKSTDPSAEIFRTEVLDIGTLRIGVVVAQVKAKENERSLMQQAIIEISPRLYYSVVMHSPSPEKGLENDEGVKEAAGVFKRIVDSIEPVDLSKVRLDQEDRLFRTRALFVGWNQKKLLSVLKPEQLLRFRRTDEKTGEWEDVGYAYIVEQPADSIPRAGVAENPNTVDPMKAAGLRVGMRMRSITEPGKPVDIESWMFVTFDRAHEVWSNVTIAPNPVPNAKDKDVWTTEVGASDLQRDRVFDKDLKPQDFKTQGPDDQVPFRMVDKYRLVVRTESRNAVAQPLQRDLPPFYLPQAIGVLLPRLVPLDNPVGYLFATYSSESRQVVLRYVDVGRETGVILGGKSIRAIPVVERLGIEGLPTTHYLSAKGEYFGSINEVSDKVKIEVVVTDRQTLGQNWKNANLTAPEGIKQ